MGSPWTGKAVLFCRDIRPSFIVYRLVLARNHWWGNCFAVRVFMLAAYHNFHPMVKNFARWIRAFTAAHKTLKGTPSTFISLAERCIWGRAYNICHPMKMQQEIYHLSQVLRVNGFPETLLKKTVATHPSRLPEP